MHPKKVFRYHSLSRRQFLQTSSVAMGAAALSGPFILRGQNLNSRVALAVIGATGKGASDTDTAAVAGADIVALCDVDKVNLESRIHPAEGARGRSYPNVKGFRDYRKMLEEINREIDGVIVATPDHHHVFAAAMAMRLGKHVYVQKPLTQSVQEARFLRQLAKETKVATQMGNQGSSGSGLRRAIEVIQAGVIGSPRELHVWSNRPIWPQGIDRPDGSDPVPETLDWDLWLGPAPVRPYKANPQGGRGPYHAFNWRGWKDFGNGALGDMACHTVNMPFRALKLGYPTVVECEAVSDNREETWPNSSRLRFEFPEREGLPPVKFWWYDGRPASQGTYRPSEALTKEIVALRGSLPGSGCLVIGDKGKVFSPDDYGSQFFLQLDESGFLPGRAAQGGEEHEAIRAIPQTIARNEGSPNDDTAQKAEWLRAIRGGPPAYSNFDVAAYLTEIILLGGVAMRVGVGKRLDWDGPNMRATNAPEAARFVKREYRSGWTV